MAISGFLKEIFADRPGRKAVDFFDLVTERISFWGDDKISDELLKYRQAIVPGTQLTRRELMIKVFIDLNNDKSILFLRYKATGKGRPFASFVRDEREIDGEKMVSPGINLNLDVKINEGDVADKKAATYSVIDALVDAGRFLEEVGTRYHRPTVT